MTTTNTGPALASGIQGFSPNSERFPALVPVRTAFLHRQVVTTTAIIQMFTKVSLYFCSLGCH